MSSSDFVVTIHAFERMEERFPDLIKGMSDVEQAHLIRDEVMDALDAGRHGSIPPIELSPRALERWIVRQRGSYVVWTKEKDRGYVLQDDDEEGTLVLTVLFGVKREIALRERLNW